VYFCSYFSRFLIFVFSVLAKRLTGKSVSEMTYFMSSGTQTLTQSSNQFKILLPSDLILAVNFH